MGDYLESIDNDPDKAFKIYKENCDTANFAKSCYKCGGYLAVGKGVPKKDQSKVITIIINHIKIGS